MFVNIRVIVFIEFFKTDAIREASKIKKHAIRIASKINSFFTSRM